MRTIPASGGDAAKAGDEGLKFFAELNKAGNLVPVIGKAAPLARAFVFGQATQAWLMAGDAARATGTRPSSSATAAKIPASDGKNVWYFIVAVDSHGNFDREPEIGSGAFQYYQQPADACLTTPRAPVLTGTASGTTSMSC